MSAPPATTASMPAARPSSRVDLPEPFSPTRKVTGALKSSRSSQRNTGTDQGKVCGSGSALRVMALRNTAPQSSDAGGELVGAIVQRPPDQALHAHLQKEPVAAEHLGLGHVGLVVLGDLQHRPGAVLRLVQDAGLLV